ncbi:MAG TPA: hypothetical protein VL949_05755 [Geobacteraceae bacterium]|nr:hypothetical protein [Geobacteraceae bacterium]
MDSYTIDIELEHYVGDRLAMNNREACRRFYVRATARFHGAELENYLRRVRTHAKAYASLSRMLQSPFRHMETPLFLSSLILCTAGIVTIAAGEFSLLVAGSTSAGIVGMIECSRKLVAFWQRHGVREAVFREFAESLPEK